MKAIITAEFEIDGQNPGEDKLWMAIQELLDARGYIGSEEIDGTDDWCLEIRSTEVRIE